MLSRTEAAKLRIIINEWNEIASGRESDVIALHRTINREVEPPPVDVAEYMDPANCTSVLTVTSAPATPPATPPAWHYSTNEERWNSTCTSATRGEAIAEANAALGVGVTFWTGLADPVTADELACAVASVDFRDAMDNHLHDNLGPEVDYELDITQAHVDELELELRPVIGAWLERHDLVPNCWTIDQVQRHVTPEHEHDGSHEECAECLLFLRAACGDDHTYENGGVFCTRCSFWGGA